MIIKAGRVLQISMRSVFLDCVSTLEIVLDLQFLFGIHYTMCYFYVIFLRCFYFICQQEYVQKIDPTSAPLSFKDELKNEVQHLTALLHFYFYYYLISLSFGSVSFLKHMQYRSGCVAILFELFLYPESCVFYL
jgi:hypothetical protein